MTEIFALLALFQLKHWLADYLLQTRYMLGKFADGWDFVLPLFSHVAVHGLMTFGIVMCFRPRLALLAMVFDMIVHFVMDRIKAAPSMLGRWRPLTKETAADANEARWRENDKFWWSVGFDQSIHHLTHYAIIYAMVR